MPTCRLADGDRIRAGGRDLTVVARPGHSTTDALFVDQGDGIAFVGDHLLAGVSSNTEIYPAAEPDGTRPRARIEYLASLRRTAAMPLDRLLTGHGEPVTEHARLIRRRFGEHERRVRASSRRSRAGAQPRSRSPSTSGRRARCASSRCSSSGRCSATWISCSTPASSRRM